MPEKIVVGTAHFVEGNGEVSKTKAGWTDYATGEVAFNPAWPGWNDQGAYMRRMRASGTYSSEDRLHVVFHEASHVHMRELGVWHRGAPLDPSDMRIAESVSRRAGYDKDEFLAEVRAAKMAGRRFGQEVLDLYERLGGR